VGGNGCSKEAGEFIHNMLLVSELIIAEHDADNVLVVLHKTFLDLLFLLLNDISAVLPY
jgi:hypothetical protein